MTTRQVEGHSAEPARMGTVKAPGARLFYQVRGSGDADAALSQFAASLTPDHLLPLLPDRQPGDQARILNSEFFLANDAPAVQRYELDLDALKRLTSQVVIAGGRDGREFPPYASASRLAGRLGISLREFPGHHAGYALYPTEFARSLRKVLEAASSEAAPWPSPPGWRSKVSGQRA